MSITVHPQAEADVEQAAAYDERQASAALAARFVAEFRRVARLVAENPVIVTPRARGRQFFPFRLLPYGLIHVAQPGGIHILIVRRDRRRPGFGSSRNPSGSSASGGA